jgi:hypothetical protein
VVAGLRAALRAAGAGEIWITSGALVAEALVIQISPTSHDRPEAGRELATYAAASFIVFAAARGCVRRGPWRVIVIRSVCDPWLKIWSVHSVRSAARDLIREFRVIRG